MLINAPSEEELCLTCHGASSTGATTDVMTGIQYAIGAGGLRGAAQLGALRGGGFDQARIDSGNMTRLAYLRSATDVSQRPKVAVGAAEDVTSAHISNAANGLGLPHVAWGNGAAGSGAGPAAQVTCASCHNPHGNGQYRILNNIRENQPVDQAWTVSIYNVAALTSNINTVTSHGLQVGDAVTIAGSTNAAINGNWFVQAVGSGAAGQGNSATNLFKISATKGGAAVVIAADGTGGTVSRTSGVPVTDAALAAAGDTRNYTVMQVKAPGSSGTADGAASAYLLYASDILDARSATPVKTWPAGTYTATGGDYFARNVPWNPSINSPACVPTAFPADASCATSPSAPNGKPSSFSGQITQWCASCHTRYFANNNPTTNPPSGSPTVTTGASWQYPRPNDSLFNHQHRTVAGRDCMTCHVSHGSNAAMTGTFSASFPYPNAQVGNSSRLLKVDNRGTCQACHDPTLTVAAGTLLPTVGPNTQVP